MVCHSLWKTEIIKICLVKKKICLLLLDRSPVNSPHTGQWRGALMFSLICARINGWINNREAGDLRRHRDHYDVTVIHPQEQEWNITRVVVPVLYLGNILNTVPKFRLSDYRSTLTWWGHEMETFSALLAICAGNSPVPAVNSLHKGQSRGALMFSLICVWINGWVNNIEADDLRRHPAHYDVIVITVFR